MILQVVGFDSGLGCLVADVAAHIVGAVRLQEQVPQPESVPGFRTWALGDLGNSGNSGLGLRSLEFKV